MKDIIKNLLPNFILKSAQDILKLSRKKRYINHKSIIAIDCYDETFPLLPFNFDKNIQSDLLATPNNIYNGEI